MRYQEEQQVGLVSGDAHRTRSTTASPSMRNESHTQQRKRIEEKRPCRSVKTPTRRTAAIRICRHGDDIEASQATTGCLTTERYSRICSRAVTGQYVRIIEDDRGATIRKKKVLHQPALCMGNVTIILFWMRGNAAFVTS
jgi:hypothetical protein